METCSVAIKRVMACLDLSAYAEATFAHALTLAKGLGAELVLLNVVNSRGLDALDQLAAEGFAVSRDKYIDTVVADRRAEFEQQYIPLAQGAPTTLLFRVGLPYDEIIKACREEGVDLLVMGTKGRTNLVGSLFGSTAEKVFRRAPCTVVSVRGPEHCALT
ncbi:MAG: universal stress protein [Thermodesulfobacteriota bacterium]